MPTTVPYPLIEVNSGMKTRLFMMIDCMPVPGGRSVQIQSGNKNPCKREAHRGISETAKAEKSVCFG